MNFDTKHVIRWGLPGWVFLISIIVYTFTYNPDLIGDIKNKDGFSIIGLAAILGGLGVPVGYLIHQVSRLFGFIIVTNRKAYFKEEFKIDNVFFTHTNGEKLKSRYVHLLTRVHELRALLYSLILSLIFILVVEGIFVQNFDTYFYISVCVNLFLLIVVYFNQKYFGENLKFLKRKIKEMPHY